MSLNFRNPLRRSRLWSIIGSIGFGALIVIGVIAGLGIISTLSLVALIGIGVYFGAVRALVNSFVIASMLKLFTDEIQKFAWTFTSGGITDEFFRYVDGAGWLTLFIVFFFALYLLGSFTSHIQLVNVTSNSTSTSGDKTEENQTKVPHVVEAQGGPRRH